MIKKRKNKAIRFLIRRVAVVLIALLLLFGVFFTISLFFHIEVIDVKGQLEIYTKEDIVDASGLSLNGNMFLFSSYRVQNRIMNSMPYVAKVNVVRKLPSTVSIQVEEADNALALPMDGKLYLMSRNFTIIDNVNDFSGKCLQIYGLTPKSLKTGDVLEDAEDEDHMKHLEMIVDGMESHEVLSSATAINVENRLQLLVLYDDRIIVDLGTTSNLERKMRMFHEMVSNQLSAQDKGRLDLSVSGKATFSPIKDDKELEQLIKQSF